MSPKEGLRSLAFTLLTAAAILILAPLVMLIAAIAILYWEPRIAIGAGLAALVVAAIALAAGPQGLAIIACFLLALGVIMLLIRYVREGEE